MQQRTRQMLLTLEQFSTLVETQLLTNIAYTGENWAAAVKPGWIVACISTEWQEFLDEVTASWKWYEKRNPKFDQQKALFELVDTAHFMACAMLLHYTPAQLTNQYESLLRYSRESAETFPNFLLDQDADFHMILDNEMGLFKSGVYWHRAGEMVRRFTHLISAGAAFLGYDAQDFFKAYKLKNERNMDRVAKGVMRGVDVKSDEKELVL